ncbi:MAG TPA: DNA cytosine methyltransferase [Smithella sp.]|nr:DNA cytosine methyltransferase [Smithella sp.]
MYKKSRLIRKKPTAIDLFCGCGGLTTGLKKAGFSVLGAVDVDPLAVSTYKANHSDVIVWEEDICKLASTELLEVLNLKKGEIDLLAGCPPCQGFSTMRTLNRAFSVDDPRNDLLLEFQRHVEEILPRVVMLENVPGLAKDHRFKTFIEKMKALGYIGNYRILNAADYGIPQRRRRLIYMGGLGFDIPFANPSTKRKTVRDSIGKLMKAGQSGDPVHDIPERRTERIIKLIKHIPKDGGSRKDLPVKFRLECHKRCTGFKDVYGRLAWNDVAPTITSGCFNPSKGRFLHPTENRAITIREAALLQGFPHRYKFPIINNKSAVALMIGNALPPSFIAAHAQCIVKKINDRELRA